MLRLAPWLLPSLVCLVVYFWGLRAWYQQDDFVWLWQRYRVANLHDFLVALFHPSQHGTFRPFSERLFLLVAGALFGADAFPVHACVMLTQCLNVVLLTWVVRRMGGSPLAATLAPILWTVNAALAFPMAWGSSYMELLCGLCLLAAFACFLRYIETGRASWWRWQWLPFLFGFGVMESMIVYPAVAASYAALRARRRLRSTVPLLGASALFYAFHSLVVHKQASGAYSMHFDLAMARTLLVYSKWALVPPDWGQWFPGFAWLGVPVAIVLGLAAAAFVARSVWKRNLLPLFGVAWFLILIAPMIPLKEHISHYYLTLPTLGLGLVGACAAQAASARGWVIKSVTAGSLLLFAAVQAPCAAAECKWWQARSKRVEAMVMGVGGVRQLHPRDAIVLTGVDETLFYGALWDHAFLAFGIDDVYVDPAARARIPEHPELGGISEFFMDPAALRQGLAQGRLRVISVAAPVPIDETADAAAAARSGPDVMPTRIDAGQLLAQPFLRGAWYAPESNHRWMGARAAVVMAGPVAPGARLYVSGYCPRAQVTAGPLAVRVTVDGARAGEILLATGDAAFASDVALPAASVGKSSIEVGLQLDRTFRAPNDNRDLGLSLTTFAIR